MTTSTTIPTPRESSARRRCGAAWLGAVLAAFSLACGDYGGGTAGGAAATGPLTPTGPVAGANPSVGRDAFATTAYPLLTQYCGPECHAGTGEGSPLVAHPDLDTAYHAVVDNQKVNLSQPDRSRLVRRLVADFHHCWSDCVSDGAEMQAAIAAWAQVVADAGGGTQVGDGITTGPLRLVDGIEDTGSERFSDHVIAFYDFKETGQVALDKSGVDPPANLTLFGAEWMSNYGISIEEGKAQATLNGSQKLYDRIADPDSGTQQYSVEAWVIPDNTDQEGPARIISYSNGTSRRNFTVGQVLYNYDFRNRSLNPEIDQNGTPSLQTYDGDQDLQATLQHVVMTYDQFRGRRIYVNTRWTDDVDEFDAGRLWNWDANTALVLGNETSGDRQWVGKIQLVAIYDHALTESQIRQNFDAGVGKRLIMRFDVSAWLGGGSYIEFLVSELDEYSYLFCRPTLVTPNPSGVRVKNMRILVNGQVPVSGQAFVTLDKIVSLPREELSGTCSIVPKDQGAVDDLFALEFEVLGGFSNPVVVEDPPTPPPVVFGAALPIEGMRDFARINESMAAVTGVDPNDPNVRATFADLEQQLPSGPDMRAFASANQVGIAKLALEYCHRMVEAMVLDPRLSDAFFGTTPSFDFGVDATVAFDPTPPATMRNVLVQGFVNGMVGANLGSQPTEAEVSVVLNDLFDDLTAGCTPATCGADRTRTVVKAACAAVMGSAALSIH